MEKILLHSCCGPCSSAVIERLIERFDVTVYFYNPNITLEDEYFKRLSGQKRLIKSMSEEHEVDIKLLTGSSDSTDFYRAASKYSYESEGGNRCRACYDLRLLDTARLADELGIETFSTTLSISPHKRFSDIVISAENARRCYGGNFLAEDFKKRDGFIRSIELSKRYGLYRQNYCGCRYSKRELAY